ncbi:MAG TPA: IS110 family transposase [Anaerolineae bacterium]|nr:IS110 family transposase [Anaerolineae bacterium]
MYPFYLGIDLHLKRTYMVLMDAKGEVIDKGRISNQKIKEYLEEKVPRDTYAVLEATRNWPFMYDLLNEHVEQVDLVHAKGVRAIANAAVKTDQIDASTLAHLARMNYIPKAYAASKEMRDLRQLLRHREWMVNQRTRAKNRIHAVLAGYNLVSPVTDLFGVAGRAYLAEVMKKELRPSARQVVEDHLAMLDHLGERIRSLEKGISLNEKQNHIVNILKSMPGVGKLNALTILAEIGCITRFHSPKSLCSWAGLTPRVHNSDAVVQHGHITKEGSCYLRTAMVRAATVACRISPRWYMTHEHLALRCGRRAARVAVARRLLTVIYYMWKRDQPYQENYGQ